MSARGELELLARMAGVSPSEAVALADRIIERVLSESAAADEPDEDTVVWLASDEAGPLGWYGPLEDAMGHCTAEAFAGREAPAHDWLATGPDRWELWRVDEDTDRPQEDTGYHVTRVSHADAVAALAAARVAATRAELHRAVRGDES